MLLEPVIVQCPLGLMLRCDNPQRAVLFGSEREWLAARARRPADPTLGDLAAGAAALEERGTTLLRAGHFAAAAGVLADCLRVVPPEERQHRAALLATQALCHLRIGQYTKAQEACEASLRLQPGSIEVRWRLAEAWLAQQRPDKALSLAQQLLTESSGDPEVLRLVQDIRRAIAEQQRGEYDFAGMRREAASSGGPVSRAHANFQSPDIEIAADLPGKGRGVRAKRALPENHLVMASRGFGVQFYECDGFHGYDPEAASGLSLPHVVHELMANPHRSAELYQLDAGALFAGCAAPHSPSSIVDVLRISRICARNSFGGGDEWGPAGGRASQRSSGVWVQVCSDRTSCPGLHPLLHCSPRRTWDGARFAVAPVVGWMAAERQHTTTI